jgi:hypothetical protein
MKNKIFSAIALACCLWVATPTANTQNIINALETTTPGEGTVCVTCDPKIIKLLGVPTLAEPPAIVKRTPPANPNGYRVQVYMSNTQQAKKEAMQIVEKMNEAFPEVAAYTKYKAPYWRVLVGDFQEQKEAEIFKQTIRNSLPELGKEITIISSKINHPES